MISKFQGLIHRLGIPYNVRSQGVDFRINPLKIRPLWAWKIKTGGWEWSEIDAMRKLMNKSIPLVELGGGFGYTSVILNKELEKT